MQFSIITTSTPNILSQNRLLNQRLPDRHHPRQSHIHHDEERDGHDDQGIFVREAGGEDATGELPVRYSEGVGDPVCYMTG